ncbi:organic cation transporter protein [Aplysia californica]|uniref:Organic cation transporter protein n=1 Tax=Aplysia californica TaxID=6500 RepID=A0ABM0JFE1_APLCA|nr:organic cation transporter protein [Aplysia californica]
MQFDDLLQYLGEFGAFQKRVYLLLCLTCIVHGMRMVVLVFLLYTPRHRCAVPGYPNDTFDITSLEHEELVNKWIPSSDSCQVYTPGNYSYDVSGQPINASVETCVQWVYDTSVFASTVVSKFDLVCDNAMKRSHATMTFYGGFLIGVFVLGAVSDIIGRKRCLFLSLTLLLLLGTGLAFAPSFLAFAILNFFVGAATTGIFSSAFVIGIELVGPSKRTYTAMLIQLFFSSGVVALAGLAYLAHHWVHLELIITIPLALFYLTWWFIPESPRWQIQRGLYGPARETVAKAAAVNRTSVPDDVIEAVMPSGRERLEEKETRINGGKESVSLVKVVSPLSPAVSKEQDESEEEMLREKDQRGRLVDLFKSKVLFLRTSVIFFNWTVISLTFYGLNFNTANLGAGSIFLNFFLAGLVEFPAHVTTLLTVDRLGRKMVHCGMLSVSGLACLACVLSILYVPTDYQWVTVALAMLGKFGAAGGFGTIYMYSTEIYPTVIRNSALGASSSWARVGAMLAPYVAAQGARTGGSLGKGIPLLVCGCLILNAAVLSIVLPETLHRKLPETIMDAKLFSRSTKGTRDQA